MNIRGLAATVLLLPILTDPAFAIGCLPEGVVLLAGVSPQCPGTGDSATAFVAGGIPNTCWSPMELDSVLTTGNGVHFYLHTAHVDSVLCFAIGDFYYFDAPPILLSADSLRITATVTIAPGDFGGSYHCDSAIYVARVGDPNGDGAINSGDVIHLVNYVFKGGWSPCGRTGDVNCDHAQTAADIIYLVGYVFKSGPSPTESCGP